MGMRSGKGGLRCGPTRKKWGLRCGSGKKRGSFPRHIPILDIYVSAPPPPPDKVDVQITVYYDG